MTVAQIQGGIGGPDDLAGRTVATTRGSTAANVARELNARAAEHRRPRMSVIPCVQERNRRR
jgi:ABC-type amino acid transport substrate-binding protein